MFILVSLVLTYLRTQSAAFIVCNIVKKYCKKIKAQSGRESEEKVEHLHACVMFPLEFSLHAAIR